MKNKYNREDIKNMVKKTVAQIEKEFNDYYNNFNHNKSGGHNLNKTPLGRIINEKTNTEEIVK